MRRLERDLIVVTGTAMLRPQQAAAPPAPTRGRDFFMPGT